ncbi:MAG: 2TM domain-containing protein [Acidobacteria bacterium]|nr:2TM domain-containing protein [Acidobacteriota bacterium]
MIFRTIRAIRFLFLGPVILGFLVLINWITTPGQWWVQWAALGIGIAWVVSLFRVITAVLVAGGIAALVAALRK